MSMKKAASMGAKLELCAMGDLMGPEAHLAWMQNWRRVKVEETAAAVKEVGAQKLHPRDGFRSDREFEFGRRAAAVRHRLDKSRPQQGSDHDDGTRGDRQATDG